MLASLCTVVPPGLNRAAGCTLYLAGTARTVWIFSCISITTTRSNRYHVQAFVDAVAATPSVKKFVVSTLENVTRVTGAWTGHDLIALQLVWAAVNFQPRS